MGIHVIINNGLVSFLDQTRTDGGGAGGYEIIIPNLNHV
jgi:hypothetical protein